MRSINWTKLLTRAGLRLLIAATCAAIFSCISRDTTGTTTFFISSGFQCLIIAPFESRSACICTIFEFKTNVK